MLVSKKVASVQSSVMNYTQKYSIPERLVSGINTQVLGDIREYEFQYSEKC